MHVKRSSITQARKKVTLYEQLIRLQGKNNDQLLSVQRNIWALSFKEATLLLNSVEFGLIKACVIGLIVPPSLQDFA